MIYDWLLSSFQVPFAKQVEADSSVVEGTDDEGDLETGDRNFTKCYLRKMEVIRSLSSSIFPVNLPRLKWSLKITVITINFAVLNSLVHTHVYRRFGKNVREMAWHVSQSVGCPGKSADVLVCFHASNHTCHYSDFVIDIW